MKTTRLFFTVMIIVLAGIQEINAQNYFAPIPPIGIPVAGSYNTGVGVDCLTLLNTGEHNTAFGSACMTNVTSGNFNSAFGRQSLWYTTTGSYNVALGASALFGNTFGNYNVAVGPYAGKHNTIGNFNTFVGPACGVNGAGNSNTFIGNVLTPQNIAFSNTVILATGGDNADPGVQRLFINPDGRAGIDVGNNPTLTNRLEINSTGAVSGTTGLRFRGLTAAALGSTDTDTRFLTVNGSGDVVLRNVSSTATGITNTCPGGVPDRTNFLVKNANNNGDLTCSSIFEAPWGGVGIGTQDPQNWLEINNQNGCGSGAGVGIRLTNTTRGCIEFFPPMGLTDPYPASLSVDQNGDVLMQMDTSIYSTDGQIWPATTTNGLRTVGLAQANLHFSSAMSSNFGHVFIGENVPSQTDFATAYTTGNYKLFVEGGILTEKAKVALRNQSNWRDDVFDNDYKLMTLAEIESFVKENKHLPGIESAEELVKNGLDLGDMQAKQMGKIEELTLYAIEQEKRLDKQSKEIEELKVLVKTLLEKK